MERTTFLGTLIARRFITLSILLGGLVVGVATYLLVGTAFTATSTHLLIPPIQRVERASAASYTAPNPLLYLGSLSQARDALIRAVSTQEVVENLNKKYPSAALKVEPDATSSGPLVVLEVSAGDGKQSVEALKFADTQLAAKLRLMQDRLDVVSRARITSLELSDAPDAKSTNRTAVRGAAFISVVVIAAGLVLIALIDRRSSERRRENSDTQ